MSTKFLSPGWRMPRNANQSKSSNYSMSFDGSSQYVDLGDDDIFSFGNGTTDSPFSISTWVKFSSTNTYESIVSKYGTQGNREYLLLLVNQKVRLYVSDTTGYNVRIKETNAAINLNSWYHICATYNGVGGSNAQNGINIYVNGVLQSATGLSIGTYTAMSNTSQSLEIAKSFLGFSESTIDAVAIYNYELSQGQVTTLYGSSSTGIGNPMSLSPKPVAYYPLGDQDAFNGADYLVPNSSLKDYVFDFYNETISSNNFIDINSLNSNILNSSFSIGIWIKKEEKPSFTDNDRIIDLTVDSNTSLQIICDNSSGKFAVNFILSGVSKINQQAFNSFTASANVWNQIVLTWDGSSYVYYFNGQPVTSTSTILVGVGGTGFFLGKRADANNTTFFNGEMSNVQIFNSALPATGSNSVETLYNNGSPLTSMSGFTSLQGWWKLDASATYDSSTNTWTIPDDSTNSNDGTSSGMTQANLVQSDLSFTSGYSPYALDFDGTNDYINIASAGGIALMNTGVSSTVSLWVYPTGTSTRVFFEQKSTGRYVIYQSGTSLFFYPNSARASFTNLILNQWYNVTTIVDGSNSKFYVNGNEVGTSTSYTPVNTLGVLQFGRSPAGIQYFEGKLSNVSIWNTALTSSQITELYNEGLPSNLNSHSAYSNLVSWWQLGENSSFDGNDWIVADEKGSNNGASTGMPVGALVNGVGTTANGVSSGMSEGNLVGDAPYSTANAISTNMVVTSRVTGSGNTP